MADTVETRYFQNAADTHTINSLTATKLITTAPSTGAVQYHATAWHEDQTPTAYYNFDIVLRHSDGSEVVLGSAVTQTTRSTPGFSMQSSTWACPQTTILTTDAIKVVMRAGLSTSEVATKDFITEQVANWAGADKSILVAATWTIYRYTVLEDDGWRRAITQYGSSDSTYHTRIAGFTYGSASITLAANAACAATATADLLVQTYISAAASAVCSATANLTTGIHLSASAVAECSVTANLLVFGWSASATVQCTTTAALNTGITMAANAACVATVQGNLQVGGITEDIDWLLQDSNGLITGAAGLTSLKIGKRSTGGLLDWNDLTFKTSGWGTLATSFQEVSSTNQRGLYRKTIELDLWADGKYYALLDYAGSPEKHYGIEFTVEGGKMAGDYVISKLDINVSSRLPTSSYTAPDNAGIAILLTDTALLIAFIKNKRYLQKTGSTWYLVIRNADDTADILRKALKGTDGTTEITDIAAAAMGMEIKSTV